MTEDIIQRMQDIIQRMRAMSNPVNIAGMARFGISSDNTLGISMPAIKNFAKEIGKDHSAALELWASGIHEAKIMAALVDDPKKVSDGQMESWVSQFDSWDVCDQVCSKLFVYTKYSYNKIFQWVEREEEFVRRASFALICAWSVHRKKEDDSTLFDFFPLMVQYSTDERNFVRKAVNWALRQVGKRSIVLHKLAIETCDEITKQHSDSKSARWIVSDAYRELMDPMTIARIKK